MTIHILRKKPLITQYIHNVQDFERNDVHCMIGYATYLFSYQQHTISLNERKPKV